MCGDGGGEAALVNKRVVVAAEQREVQQGCRSAGGPVCDVMAISATTCVGPRLDTTRGLASAKVVVPVAPGFLIDSSCSHGLHHVGAEDRIERPGPA